MSVKFANNAHSTLAASVSTSATSITVASGQGARFPSLSSGEYFYATLIDTSNNLEIVKVTGRSTDVLTATRAQEGTTARAFASGDRIELRVTAQSLVDHRVIAADEIVNSMIATDAVNSDSIAANAVTASELNISGNGTAGQSILSDGDGSFSYGSSGVYSVHAFDEYSYATQQAYSSSGDYFDIAGGNYVQFTPTSTDDLVFFRHNCQMYFQQVANGGDVYLMMSTSTSIGASDTKLNYNGQHSVYFSQESAHHETANKTFILKCTGLTVGTTYYVEQAGAKHNGVTISFNHSNTNNQGHMKHNVQLIHYKKN